VNNLVYVQLYIAEASVFMLKIKEKHPRISKEYPKISDESAVREGVLTARCTVRIWAAPLPEQTKAARLTVTTRTASTRPQSYGDPGHAPEPVKMLLGFWIYDASGLGKMCVLLLNN